MNPIIAHHRVQCAANAKAWKLLGELTNSKPPLTPCFAVATDGNFRVTISVADARQTTDVVGLWLSPTEMEIISVLREAEAFTGNRAIAVNELQERINCPCLHALLSNLEERQLIYYTANSGYRLGVYPFERPSIL